ncbi:hypothetical protein GCM10019016_045510 [Streptomyces prasinosporus]|uniref:Uncharacterized protein n=1 Tax=Streptomyces prasinosporus TaxID=68256 RepID=A0ABP6TQ70_9ACTN
MTPPARTPSRGASKARAEASATESAPPEQATSTSGEGGTLVRDPAGASAVVVEDVGQDAADRQAYRRDRRMGTHVRFPS